MFFYIDPISSVITLSDFFDEKIRYFTLGTVFLCLKSRRNAIKKGNREFVKNKIA